jgi:hypothetical protein
VTISTTSPDYPCDRCGNPKGSGWGTPIYGAPYCIPCCRAMEREEAEAKGEKYERYYCIFGWDNRIGGASCTGTNWEWTRNQIVGGLLGRDKNGECETRWDCVNVRGPGHSMRFTRRKMPGDEWGTYAPSTMGKIGGRLRQVLGLQKEKK